MYFVDMALTEFVVVVQLALKGKLGSRLENGMTIPGVHKTSKTKSTSAMLNRINSRSKA